MRIIKLGILFMILPLFFFGCGHSKKRSKAVADPGNTTYYTAPVSATPIVISHVDIERKKEYIRQSVDILKHFYLVAHDVRQKYEISAKNALGREVSGYILSYVEPVLNDDVLMENSGTRAEIAKLYMLSASVYYELSGYCQSRYYVNILNNRFDRNFLTGVAVDPACTGFRTIAEGVDHLKRMVNFKLASNPWKP